MMADPKAAIRKIGGLTNMITLLGEIVDVRSASHFRENVGFNTASLRGSLTVKTLVVCLAPPPEPSFCVIAFPAPLVKVLTKEPNFIASQKHKRVDQKHERVDQKTQKRNVPQVQHTD